MVYVEGMKEYVNKELGSKIFIENDAYTNLLIMKKESCQFETGGILIGYYDEECQNAIIKECTSPPEDSEARRNYFFRGIKGLKCLLKERWEKKREYYLGEWHLHPNASPIPSITDVAQMKKIEHDPQFNCKEPILLILGEKSNCTILNLIVFKNNKQYFYNETN